MAVSGMTAFATETADSLPCSTTSGGCIRIWDATVRPRLCSKKVIAISEKTVGGGNQGTARARWAYANVLLCMQRNEEALEQSAAALAIHEKVLGAPHQ